MKTLIAAIAVVIGLAFSGVALASTCPLLIKQGKDAAAKMKADDPKVKEANAKLTEADRKSTRLNSSHIQKSRMPSSA